MYSPRYTPYYRRQQSSNSPPSDSQILRLKFFHYMVVRCHIYVCVFIYIYIQVNKFCSLQIFHIFLLKFNVSWLGFMFLKFVKDFLFVFSGKRKASLTFVACVLRKKLKFYHVEAPCLLHAPSALRFRNLPLSLSVLACFV